MVRYFLTYKAVEDLTKIWDHTYEVWSENQADKYYKLIIEASEEIANAPEIRKSYDEIIEEILGFRAGKHIFFYRKREPKGIEVVRILHERMAALKTTVI